MRTNTIRKYPGENTPESRHSRFLGTRPTIGILSHGFSGDPMWAGAAQFARQRDVNLIGFAGGILHSHSGFEAQGNVLFDLVGAKNVDGLVIAGILGHNVGPEKLGEFCKQYQDIPLVSLEVPLPGIPSVLLDFYQGMREVLVHLIEVHGYRRVAFIRGPEESVTGEERFRAYTDVLTEYGIPLDVNAVAPGTFFAPSGEEAVRLLLEKRKLHFEAIVAANDYMALDAVQALQRRGIRVPEDIAVVGFDEQKETGVVTPPLTTAQLREHELGQRAVGLLLDMLEGKNIPERVILPTQLVVRQSCGCPSSVVKQAVVGRPITVSSEPVETAFTTQREHILTEMKQALEQSANSPDGVVHLLDSFIAEMKGEAPGAFLSTLKELLRSGADERNVTIWSNILSTLRRQAITCLDSAEALTRAEDLWHQARILIGESAEREQACQSMQVEQEFIALRGIGQALITTFDVPELMDILARELPRIGIPAGYLALYENYTGSAEEHPPVPPERGRLMLAYSERGRVQIEAGGQLFSSSSLVPAGMLPDGRRRTMIVEALYFREKQLGFFLFEEGLENIVTRTAHLVGTPGENPLRGEISNALQGALLVQQIKTHAAELARKQYILDAFMENVPDRICFKDCEGRFTRANKAYVARLGLSKPGEEAGKTDFDFFSEEQARMTSEQEQTIMRTGQPLFTIEEQTVWPDGRADWALTTKMPLRDEHGNVIGIFGISRDITDLKEAEQEVLQYRDHLEDLVNKRTTELARSNARLHEEIIERRRVEHALRASEQQYRTLAENVMDGLVIVQDGKVILANKVFAAMTGHSPEHFVMSDSDKIFHDCDGQTGQAWFHHGSAAGSPASQRHAEIITKDGRTIWVEFKQTEIAWNGQPALLLTIRDITDRKIREQRLEEERVRLQEENLSLKSSIRERYRFGALIGKSPAMQRVYELLVSAAPSDVNILISGESGTGKELIARTIHQISRRKLQPFVPVNCASIPEALFEREFFGHHKGAFTGADQNKPGLFDRAHQGVLFLDEVTELSPGAQAKLLRVLQDGEYTPLGSNRPKQADVLIVAATNKEYQEEIRLGGLRKDFFYRICVVVIDVPPLRERKDDLPLLIEDFLERYHQNHGQVSGSIPHNRSNKQAMLPSTLVEALYAYDWPGNVRELQNVLQRYLVTGNLNAILSALGVSLRVSPGSSSDCLRLPELIQILEKRKILEALTHTHYHIVKAAQILGIPRSSLYRKIKQYHLERPYSL